ncbi:MAG: DMT family transporter [Rectinemataceae bacterium]
MSDSAARDSAAPHKEPTRFATYAAGVGYAAIFGFSFLVTKGALDILDPLELLFARFLVAALAMTLLAFLRLIRLDFRGKLGGASLGAARGEALRILGLSCLFQPVLYFLFETYGVRESATSTAGLILGALPASVAVLGFFMLKEKLGRFQTLGLAFSVIGVAFVALSGASANGGEAHEGSLAGVLLLFASMASAAFFNVLSRKASRYFSDIERTFAMMWTGAVVFGLAVAVTHIAGKGGQADIPAGFGGEGLFARMFAVWPALLYLGLLSSVVAFFLINYTLSRLKASQAAVFANLTTAITVAAGVILRGEAFGISQAAGAIMIIAGVWAANRRSGGAKP